jgi:hypothetical protein
MVSKKRDFETITHPNTGSTAIAVAVGFVSFSFFAIFVVF